MFIPIVKNDQGDTITSRKGIADVIGEFYSKLFASNETEEKHQDTLNHDTRADDEEKTMVKVTMKKYFWSQMKKFRQQSQAQERQSQGQPWNPCRGHQDLWQWDERNDKTDLQRSIKARKLYSMLSISIYFLMFELWLLRILVFLGCVLSPTFSVLRLKSHNIFFEVFFWRNK